MLLLFFFCTFGCTVSFSSQVLDEKAESSIKNKFFSCKSCTEYKNKNQKRGLKSFSSFSKLFKFSKRSKKIRSSVVFPIEEQDINSKKEGFFQAIL